MIASRRIQIAALLIALLALSGCAVSPDITPTATPTPSPLPSTTPTTAPTATATATPIPGMLLPAPADKPLPEGATAWLLGDNPLAVLAYSPEGNYLAVSSEKGIHIYESSSMELQKTLPTATRPSQIAWSPDGKQMAGGFDDGTVRIWDVETSDELSNFQVGVNPIASISWSPDGKRLAAGTNFIRGEGPTTRVWYVGTQEEAYALEGVHNFFPFITWSPDGNQLAGGCLCNMVLIWDSETGKILQELRGYHDNDEYIPWSESLAWSPSGNRLAYALGTPIVILIYDTLTGEKLATLAGHTLEGIKLAWSPDGEQLASGSYDSTVQIWDMSTLEGSTVLSDFGRVRSVAWSPDGDHVAVSTGGNSYLIILNVDSLQ